MKNLAVVCGGYTDEKVISAQSAQTVIDALKDSQFSAYKVWIDEAIWQLQYEGENYPIDKNDFSAHVGAQHLQFDIVFNTIHGTPGENGLLQGYFDILQIPYNNCGVFTSSLTFHKAACNRYLGFFGIKSAESVLLKNSDSYDVAQIISNVGLPCFVKPNGSGSSLGITKVKEEDRLAEAIEKAFTEDDVILIERFMDGMEVTCGAYSIDLKPKSLAVTEVVVEQEFFDYEAKYHDQGTQEITPARISTEQYNKVMQLTEEIYKILDCAGIIRVDYIIENEEILVIEVNTTPGLSSRSFIPQQVEYIGMSLPEFFESQLKSLRA